MSRFIVYCLLCAVWFLMAFLWLRLHWFWSGASALLWSGLAVFAVRRILTTRTCPSRVRRALAAGDTELLRVTIEKAFLVPSGDASGLDTCFADSPNDAGTAGLLAYLPASLMSYAALGLLMGSGVGRTVLAALLGIPCAVLVGMLVDRMVGRKATFRRIKGIVSGDAPQTWDQLMAAWGKRREACLVVDRSTGQVKARMGGFSMVGSMLDALARLDAQRRSQQEIFEALENQRGFRCRNCGRVYCLDCLFNHAPAHPNGGKACPVCGGVFAVLD